MNEALNYNIFLFLKNFFKKKYWPTVKMMQIIIVKRLKYSTRLCALSVSKTKFDTTSVRMSSDQKIYRRA